MNDIRPKADMRRWLRRMTPDESFAGVVLKKGDWFFGRANVSDYEVTASWKKLRRPRAQECFYNAQKFCIDHHVPYWEGYFLIRGWPLHHAWVVMDDGLVVDFTLEAVIRKAKREHDVVDETTPLYLGVNVPRRFIMEHIIEGGSGEPVAEQYHSQMKRKAKRST